MGGSLPLAYYNALQEERGEPGPGTECVTSEPVPRVMVTRLHGWCLPRRMEGGKENKVMLICITIYDNDKLFVLWVLEFADLSCSPSD